MTIEIRSSEQKTTTTEYDGRISTLKFLPVAETSVTDYNNIISHHTIHPFRDEEDIRKSDIASSIDSFRQSSSISPTNLNSTSCNEALPLPVISPSPSLRIHSPDVILNDKDSIDESCDSTGVECDSLMSKAQHDDGTLYESVQQTKESTKVSSSDFPLLHSSVKESNVDRCEMLSVDIDKNEELISANDNQIDSKAISPANENDDKNIAADADTSSSNSRRMTRSLAKGYVHTTMHQPTIRAPRARDPKSNNTKDPSKTHRDRSKKGKTRPTTCTHDKDASKESIPRRVTRLSESLSNPDNSTPGVLSVEDTYVPLFPESKLPMPKICVTNNGNGHHCLIHEPSLEELESLNSFGSYIRDVVLPAASMYEVDKNHPNYSPDFYMKTKMELGEGMALVRLPRLGFGCSKASSDRTGRGPMWEEGTELGDWVIESPMEQIVLGIGGVYEFTFVDKPQITMSEFRKRADAHKQQQIGNFLNRVNIKRKDDNVSKSQQTGEAKLRSAMKVLDDFNPSPPQLLTAKENPATENESVDEESTIDAEEDIELLERQFWKRIGPTMIPAWYGADQEDTLFYHENEIDHADPTKCNAAATWSLCQLDSCLQVLPPIPGVTSPYLYVGMWGSVFCSHTEDMNLLSINYLHAGSPKLWYSIAEPDAARYTCLAEHYYSRVAAKCKEFLRHKRYLLSPAILQKAGIRYQTAIQYPGDAVITMPGGYHFGFNLGFNVAEATNFGVPEWLPFGRDAKVCLCRPDSVRIDMFRLTELIRQFHVAQKRNRRLTFAEWKRKQDWQNRIHGTQSDGNRNEATADGETDIKSKRKRMTGGPLLHAPLGMTEQQRRNEFWIEVMKPVTGDGRASGSKKKRKKTMPKKAGPGTGGKDKKKEGDISGEVWHLAKPINRTSNKIVINSRVLCIIPASPNMQHINFNGINAHLADGFFNGSAGMQLCNDNMEMPMDEQCFAGQVVEIMDHFARIHLIGLHRTEDIWMSIHNPRLFLDGGQFIFGVHEDIPPLHYWQEMDSKTRLK